MLASVRNEYCFHYPKPDEMERAYQRAAASGEMEEADWGMYFTNKLLNVCFFVSDYVYAHGISNAVAEPDVAKAHEKLLMSLGPIANDLTSVTYGYAEAIFKKYLGNDLSMTVVAKVTSAPHINDLTLPFYVEMPENLNELR